MNITITTIPHEQQRYTTVGDWTFDSNGDLTIKVSKLSDWRREFLIAVHELIEVGLCKHDGISQEQVDAFDMGFKEDLEPGDESNSPYREPHCFVTGFERLLCARLGVDWKDYERELCDLPEVPQKQTK